MTKADLQRSLDSVESGTMASFLTRRRGANQGEVESIEELCGLTSARKCWYEDGVQEGRQQGSKNCPSG